MAKRKLSTFERLQRGSRLNYKQRKELTRRLASNDPGLEIVHPNAAGIDIGNESHFAAVAPGRDPQPVREFGSWTAGLLEMAAWLKSCGIKDVVMQSTGVYWIAAYDVLEKAGFRVCLSNARETKNLPGRKSDVQESQWLLKLHTYGLLRNSFRPPEEIRAIRTIWRLRARHVEEASREIQHMQKALTIMNVHLPLTDISGVTGQRIIRAILKGERDTYKLAEMKDYRVHASLEELARSLEGYWQPDGLFDLQQAVDAYDFRQRQLEECDQQLQRYLKTLPDRKVKPEAVEKGGEEKTNSSKSAPKPHRKSRKTPRDNEPKFDLESEQTRICGVPLTSIDGVGVMTVQTFVSELGVDMSPWPREDNLVSWLKLSPKRPVSGGKVIKQQPCSNVKNRTAEALRMAASSLKQSESYLGARFRYLRSRLGPKAAIKAMAAHLARLIYRMLKHGQAWIDQGMQEHERKRTEREKQSLSRKAAALGFQLVPA